MSRPAWMPEGQDYRCNVLFRDGSRLHGLTEAELAQHDGHISQVWRVPVWPAAGVMAVAPAGVMKLVDDYASICNGLGNASGQGRADLVPDLMHRKAAARAAVEAVLAPGVTACPKCGDSGWKPNRDANGERVWTPLMNDALPCECGALARKIAAQKAAAGVSGPSHQTFSQQTPTAGKATP